MLEETLTSRLFLPLPAFLFCPLILDRAELAVNRRRIEKTSLIGMNHSGPSHPNLQRSPHPEALTHL